MIKVLICRTHVAPLIGATIKRGMTCDPVATQTADADKRKEKKKHEKHY